MAYWVMFLLYKLEEVLLGPQNSCKNPAVPAHIWIPSASGTGVFWLVSPAEMANTKFSERPFLIKQNERVPGQDTDINLPAPHTPI